MYNASTGKWVSQAFSATSALSEAVQDIVGAMATDNTDINFTYDDGAGTLVATVIESGVDHDALANFAADEHVAHSGVTLTAGAGLTGGGDISASRSFAVGAGTGITVNADDVALSATTIASLALADSAAQPGDAEAITGAWTFGTAAQIEFLGGTDLWIRDAGFLRIYDSGDTDYGQFSHNGTNFLAAFTNTATVAFSGASTSYTFDKSLSIDGSTNLSAGNVYRWTDDQDTYLANVSANALQLVTGGTAVATFSTAEIDLTATTLDFNGAADFSSYVRAAGYGAFQGSYASGLTGPHVFLDADGGVPRLGGLTTGGTIQPLFIRASTTSIGDASGTYVAVSSAEIDLTATTLDFNGAADFSSTITAAGAITVTVSADSTLRQFFDNDSTGASAASDIRLSAGTTDGFVGVTGSGNSSAVWTNGPAATHMYLGTNFSGAISFGTNAVERLRIAGDGSEVRTNNLNAEPLSRSISASETTAATDQGIVIRLTGGSGQTLTLDGDPPTDATVVIDNSAGAAWTIAASGTLIWASTAGTGNRTLADDGMAVALHRGSGVWLISGNGLS